jgi:hypothetical protein
MSVMDTVRDAREAYFSANGFSPADYEAKWTPVSFFALKLAIPNTPRHAWAIRLHDLHHVATGYGTDLVGEGEISCWELAGGLRGLDAYVSGIICAVAATGFLLSPRRMVRAWKRGRGAQPLWKQSTPVDELLALSIADLRARVGVTS